MSDTEAKITLSADDKASPVIQQAARNFESLRGTLVDIAPYMDGTYKNFDEMGNVIPEATTAVGGFNLASVALIATGVSLSGVISQAGAAVKDFAASSLEAAAQLQIF